MSEVFPIGVAPDTGFNQEAAPEGHTHQFFNDPILLSTLSRWTQNSTSPLRVYKSADFCFVNGVVAGTDTPANDTITFVPSLYRPPYLQYTIASPINADEPSPFFIDPISGALVLANSIGGTRSYLFNCMYRLRGMNDA